MTFLIDGVTPLPANGDTGWGTTLNTAISSIDDRFTWISGNAVAKKVDASGVTGTTLASNVVTSSLTSVGTLASLGVSGAVTVGGNLTVSGDFTVNGTTTTINTTTLNVSDNIIILNNDVTGSPSENAGIEVERGTSTNVMIRWNETSDKWELTTDGTTYRTFATLDGSESLTNKKLGSLTTNGLVTTSAGDGTLSVTTMGAGIATFLTTPSSANLASAITDETGSGALVFSTSPTFSTSVIAGSATMAIFNTTATTVNAFGAATAISLGAATGTTTINNGLAVTGTTSLGGKTVSLAGNLTTSGAFAITLTATNTTSVTLPTSGTLVNDAVTALSSLATVGTITSGAWQSSTPVGLAYGGTGKTSAPAAMANLMGYTSTATSGGTTTLTNTSSYYQQFTGSSNQTVVLPVTSTLQTGWTFHIVNNSAGTLTVNSSGGNLVTSVPSEATLMVTCIGTTLTTAADWKRRLTGFSIWTGAGGVVLANNPSFLGSIGATSSSFDLINTFSTTINFGGAATAINIGAATGTTTINNGLTTKGTTILGPTSINGQSAAYTLALTDAGKTIEMTNASEVAITVPPSGTVNFPIGTQIAVVRNNGKVSFTPGAGVTIRSDSAKLYISTQYSAATLIKRDTDEWYLIGNLSAS